MNNKKTGAGITSELDDGIGASLSALQSTSTSVCSTSNILQLSDAYESKLLMI